MKTIIIMTCLLGLAINQSHAQINNMQTATVKVYGNCDMCETTIEKAADEKKISKADWNKDSKTAVITYDAKKTTLNAVLKKIALAGYDNEQFLAPDAAYARLPGCCKYDRNSKTAAPAQTTTHDHSAHKEHPAATQQAGQLQPVFDQYFALKDALVKSDATATAAKAASLLAAVKAVKMETLKPEEHTVWMAAVKDLEMNAEHISATGDIGHQREHFILLSKSIISLARVSKPAGTVYIQHCPMANDGKGADWLSKENTVKNPYYGAAMLSCGKTTETIRN